MTIQLKLRGGTAAEHTSFIGLAREVTVNTTNNTLRVHDGVTPGGVELLKADLSNKTVDLSDAATLNGQAGSYYLNYNNLNNKPSIPSIVGLASETYVNTKINDLVAGAEGALNTLNELAEALGNDENFAANIAVQLSTKLNNSGDTMTGVLEITDNTASSSTTTGALKVVGGVGIGEDLYVGGDVHATYLYGDASFLTNVGGLIGLSYYTTYAGSNVTVDAGNYVSVGFPQPIGYTCTAGVISFTGNPVNLVTAGFTAGSAITIQSTFFGGPIINNKVIQSVSANAITLTDNTVTGIIESLDWAAGGSIVATAAWQSGPRENVAIGPYALDSLSATGIQNTAVGEKAGTAVTSGDTNCLVGYNAAASLTTGSNNLVIGANGMPSMVDGSNNIVIGLNALATATTGNNAIAIGNGALRNKGPNSGGALAIGNNAGFNYGIGGATASGATIIGTEAMYNGGGLTSTAIGYQALYQAGGNANIGIGAASGYSLVTGNFNVILGSNSGTTINGTNNNIIISDGQGNIASNWTVGGGWYQANNNASWSVTSDARLKTNIQDIENGLDIILALKPKSFDRIVEGTHDVGFIAQDYELVLPEQVKETPAPRPEFLELTEGQPVKGIDMNLIPYLVSAIHALKQENDLLKARLDSIGA